MSRKPDFTVKAMDKTTDEKNKVGGAWTNKDGTISIVLSPFIVLRSHPDLLITLFPATMAE